MLLLPAYPTNSVYKDENSIKLQTIIDSVHAKKNKKKPSQLLIIGTDCCNIGEQCAAHGATGRPLSFMLF